MGFPHRTAAGPPSGARYWCATPAPCWRWEPLLQPRGRGARTAPRAGSLPVPPSSVHCVSVVFSVVSCLWQSETNAALVLELDVFPGIGVSGRDRRRKHILPFRRRDPGADGIDEGMAEDRNEVVVLEDLALDLLGQRLPLSSLVRCHILVELGIGGA